MRCDGMCTFRAEKLPKVGGIVPYKLLGPKTSLVRNGSWSMSLVTVPVRLNEPRSRAMMLHEVGESFLHEGGASVQVIPCQVWSLLLPHGFVWLKTEEVTSVLTKSHVWPSVASSSQTTVSKASLYKFSRTLSSDTGVNARVRWIEIKQTPRKNKDAELIGFMVTTER